MVPGMIGRDYFKRQATTLRKMVKVAKDPTVADRLSDMACEFEERAGTERRVRPAASPHRVAAPMADDGHGYGQCVSRWRAVRRHKRAGRFLIECTFNYLSQT